VTRKRIWVGDLVSCPSNLRHQGTVAQGAPAKAPDDLRAFEANLNVGQSAVDLLVDTQAAAPRWWKIRITSRTARSTGTISTSGDFSVDPPRRRWRRIIVYFLGASVRFFRANCHVRRSPSSRPAGTGRLQ
jgi:hypothetical protein